MRDQYLNMRVEAETKRRLDELRRIEQDIPGQTAMVERLIDRAYDKEFPVNSAKSLSRQGKGR